MPGPADSSFRLRTSTRGWTGLKRQDTGMFSLHNPASAFPSNSWLSFLIFNSGPYALSFPASQDFLALFAVCHSVVRLARKVGSIWGPAAPPIYPAQPCSTSRVCRALAHASTLTCVGFVVSTAFRNRKPFPHQYFEVTL